MIVDGNKLALEKEGELKKKIKSLKIKPKLVVLVLANDKAGLLYSELKKQAAERIGIDLRRVIVETGEELFEQVRRYSLDETVDGVVVQYPGFKVVRELAIEWDKLVSLIDKEKDVDGLRDDSEFELGAVKAVVELVCENLPLLLPLRSGNSGSSIVVVGAKGFVGKRMVEAFKDKNFRVVGVDKDDDLVSECKRADILVSCTGKTGIVTKEMVKDGAMVIDVGWPKGDVCFDEVYKQASLITPVPGGIGPLTVVYLLENLVNSLYSS